MERAALPHDWAYLQRRSIRKSGRSALTSINSNNFNLYLAHDVLVSLAAVFARLDKHMLKITKQAENARLTRVTLHGHLTAEYVPEVEKALSENGCKSGKVALDLRNVTFVDRTAMEFLCTAKSKKIRIENTPSYVTIWMEQETS
jgi:ABC-type transporter Mla MlaB component